MVRITTVGHAYLKLMPSLQGLGRYMRDEVRKAEREAPPVTLTAQIHSALLREQIRAAARDGDRTAVRLRADVDSAAVDAQFAALVRRLSGHTATVRVDADTSRLTQLARGLADASAGAGRAGAGFTQLTLSVGATTLRFAALAAMVGQAIGVLGALGGAVATASGSLLLLPAAGLAAAVAVQTAKLGVQGFSDALDATDPAEFEKALSALAPAAQDAARAVRALGPEWTALRLDVQQALFAGLAAQINALGGVYLPVLRTGLSQVAASLNAGTAGFGQFAREGRTIADVQSILDNSAVSVRQLAGGVAPFLQGLRDIAAVGSEFLPGFASSLAGSAQRFAEFIATARQSGQLREWIAQGLAALGELFTVLGNLVKIVATVFQAADAGGVSLLSTLSAATASLLGFLRSAEGARALEQIFTGLRSVAEGLRPIFTALGGAVVTSIAPAVELLGSMVGSALASLAPAVAPAAEILASLAGVAGSAAQALASVLVPAVRAVAPVIAKLAPVAAELAELLGDALGSAITDVAPALLELASSAAPVAIQFGQLLANALRVLAPLLGQLLTALAPIAATFAGSFLSAVNAALPVVTQLALILGQLLTAGLQPLLPVLPVIVSTISQLAMVVSTALSAAAPILAQIGQLVGQLLAQALNTLLPLIPPVAQAFMQVVSATLPLVPVLLELVSALLPPLLGLVTALVPVVVQGAETFAALLSAAAPFASFIAGMLVPQLQALLTVASGVFRGIAEIVGGAMRAAQGVIDVVLGLITGDWSRAWSGIKDFLGGIWSGILGGIGTALGSVVDFFVGLPGRLLSALGNLGGLLVEAGKSIIRGLVDGIVAGFRWVRDKLGELTNMITSWKGPPARDKVLLTPNGRLIMEGLIRGMRAEEPRVRRYLTNLTNTLPDLNPVTRGVTTYQLGSPQAPQHGIEVSPWQRPDPAMIADAVTTGVLAALDGARMSVDGSGVAQLVNTHNARNLRR